MSKVARERRMIGRFFLTVELKIQPSATNARQTGSYEVEIENTTTIVNDVVVYANVRDGQLLETDQVAPEIKYEFKGLYIEPARKKAALAWPQIDPKLIRVHTEKLSHKEEEEQSWSSLLIEPIIELSKRE